LAFALSYANREEESLLLLDRLGEVHPKNGMIWVVKARILMSTGRYEETQKMLDIATRVEANLPFCKLNQGLLFALTGRKKEAEEKLKEIVNSKNEFAQLTARLQINTALGRLDDAFEALEKMAETHSWDWMILYSPFLRELRADLRFTNFCNKVGIPTQKERE
jgi:predicted Zn-dependent protease